MIRQLRLENFKAFGLKQNIPIRPITLIYGPNSSGKTSILNALLLLKQTIEESENYRTPLLYKGSLTDQQNFSRCVNKRDVSKSFSIGVGHDPMGWGYNLLSAERYAALLGIDDDVFVKDDDPEERKLHLSSLKGTALHLHLKNKEVEGRENIYCNIDDQTILKKINYFINDETFCSLKWVGDKVFREDGTNALFDDDKNVHVEEPLVEKYKDKIPDEYISDEYFGPGEWWHNQLRMRVDLDINEGRIGNEIYKCQPYIIDHTSIKEELIVSIYDFLNEKYLKDENYLYSYDDFKKDLIYNVKTTFIFVKNGVPFYSAHYDGGVFNREKRPFLCNLKDEKFKKSKLYKAYNFFADNITGKCESFKHLLKDLTYVGPLRKHPERFTDIIKDSYSSVGVDGERTTAILYENPKILAKVNSALERLGLSYQLEIKTLENEDFVAFGDIYSLQIIDAKTKTPLTLCDVGFGISQVLPILVQSLMPQHKTILIEQPEIHLHPRMQTELGDFFIRNSGRGKKEGFTLKPNNIGRQFLIETHSEHLLLRILRRIRETTEGKLIDNTLSISPEDVSIIYVQQGENGAEVIELPVNADGEFERPWPQGFFAERVEEYM